MSGSIEQNSACILSRNESSSNRWSRGLVETFEASSDVVRDCDNLKFKSCLTFGGEVVFLGGDASVIISSEHATFLGFWVSMGTPAPWAGPLWYPRLGVPLHLPPLFL